MKIQVTINGAVVFEENLHPGDACSMELKDDDAAKSKFSEVQLAIFDVARKAYPGKKRGLTTEFTNYRKRHRDWKDEIPKLFGAIEAQKKDRALKIYRKEFAPEWPMFQVWINQRRWEMEEGAKVQQQILDKSITFNKV